MKVEELKVTIVLKRGVSFRNIGEQIGALLHFAMLQDPVLKAQHRQKKMKHYSFSHLSPIEPDGVYKAGIGYTFRLRSANEDFLRKMEVLLKETENAYFLVLLVEKQLVPKGNINGVRTLTPFIITLKNGATKYWKVNESTEDIRLLLTNNISHKYRQWTGERIEHPFIKEVKMLNQKPTYVLYKDIKMLGNKSIILFHNDKVSTDIRDFVVCTGVGEKSSALGGGFSETL